MVQSGSAAAAEVKDNYTSFRAWLKKISQYSYFLSRKARNKKIFNRINAVNFYSLQKHITRQKEMEECNMKQQN
jgi:hypothetical protein